jgi:hypothetical protein
VTVYRKSCAKCNTLDAFSLDIIRLYQQFQIWAAAAGSVPTARLMVDALRSPKAIAVM